MYYTDAEGYYGEETNTSSNPRLKGWTKTDSDGRDQFRTIKPGSYPSGRTPAHIDYVLSGSSYPEQYDELMFGGGPDLNHV